MINIFICEDDDYQRNTIESKVRNIIKSQGVDMRIASSKGNPDELIDNIKCSVLNLYILDIELKHKMSGLDLGKAIRTFDPCGLIIYLTSYQSYKELTFEYKIGAYDYINKSEAFRNTNILLDVLTKAEEKLTLLMDNSMNKIYEINKDGFKFYKQCIQMISLSDKVHHISLYINDTIYEQKSSLEKVHKFLNKDFVRCHNAYIVNTRKIKEINKKNQTLTLDNGHKVKMSVRGSKLIRDVFNNRL